MASPKLVYDNNDDGDDPGCHLSHPGSSPREGQGNHEGLHGGGEVHAWHGMALSSVMHALLRGLHVVICMLALLHAWRGQLCPILKVGSKP